MASGDFQAVFGYFVSNSEGLLPLPVEKLLQWPDTSFHRT